MLKMSRASNAMLHALGMVASLVLEMAFAASVELLETTPHGHDHALVEEARQC